MLKMMVRLDYDVEGGCGVEVGEHRGEVVESKDSKIRMSMVGRLKYTTEEIHRRRSDTDERD